MNAKLTIVILIAVLAAVLVPVSAENVYVDRNPALFDVPPPDAYGYVVFYIRAGGSAQDLNVWIGNDAKNATFDPTYHPDKTAIEGQNPDFLKVKVLPDGVSEPEQLSAGNYTAYLQKGNGDQIETFKFKIGGGGTERVQFLGAAVSSADPARCKPVYKIITATYGSGGCWEIEVIDVPAYDEVIEHPAETRIVHHEEVNHTVHHDAIIHEEFVVEGTYQITNSRWIIVNWNWVEQVRCTNPAHFGWHTQIPACTEAYGHYEMVVDVPAWDEIVVDEPAWDETVIVVEPWTEIIHHPAETHYEQKCNEMVDVTAAVQGIVGSGTHQFYFDTNREEGAELGGIFSITAELLYQMANPSEQGFTNMATVSYENGCGASGTMTGTDFCVFDVETGTVSCEASPA